MIHRSLLPTALAIVISTSLLAACAGGGGARGFVRPQPQPQPQSPPPLPDACPAPVNADCVIDASADDYQYRVMTGGRQSDHALIKDGKGYLYLKPSDGAATAPAEFHFDGGTTINDGAMVVRANSALYSNVTVQSAGTLHLEGGMTGNVDNHGAMLVVDKVIGNVTNDGVIIPLASVYGDVIPARIEGNFNQTSNGTLIAVTPTAPTIGDLTGGFLSVTGRADVDGTMQVSRYDDDLGPYPLPGTPVSLQVLHADGGVFGQFAQWTAPGLLITGSLRYLANDVYFDMATLSAAATMTSAGAGDALTLHAAGTFDAALVNASHWATPGATLSATQRRFLTSVGTLQRLQDYGQAIRSFDSLAGHGYADAADALLQQATMPGSDVMTRLDNLPVGSAPQSWASQTTLLAPGAGATHGQRTGFDQWFGERLLLGASLGWTRGNLRFDRAGGTAQDQSPQWDVYLRRNGNRNTYLFGDVGYSHHQMNLSRRIDLGLSQHMAGAQHNLDVLRAYMEVGRDFHVAGTKLTPFGAMSYAALHAAPFTEHGITGFELIAQSSVYKRVNATAGLRLGTRWVGNSGRWTQWNVAAGYRQLLDARDDARAAFTGAPEATFALEGMPQQRHTGWVQANLATGGARWNWLLSYDRQGSDQALSMGAAVRF